MIFLFVNQSNVAQIRTQTRSKLMTSTQSFSEFLFARGFAGSDC